MLVKEMYDKLALITAFPIYTNETDTPEINRFLLEMLSEALQNTIDGLYISNNVLERNDTIITTPNRDLYGIEGIIKNIQLVKDNGHVVQIHYDDYTNPNNVETEASKKGEPRRYVIKNGYLKLLPTPDKAYTIKVCVSTTDLVMANNDTSRTDIRSINDSIVANSRFCNLVITKAAELVFARLQNPNMQIYARLYSDNLKTFLEHDLKTIEAQRGFIRRAGHYDPAKGLLDDNYYGGYFRGDMY